MTKSNNRDDRETNRPGQSGDDQQINDRVRSSSESVEELLEEGNAYEADVVEGVENADDPDVSEVITRQVPEDDVPEEYLNDDNKDVA